MASEENAFPRVFCTTGKLASTSHELREGDMHQMTIFLGILTVVTHFLARNLPRNTVRQIEQRKDQNYSPGSKESVLSHNMSEVQLIQKSDDHLYKLEHVFS